MCAYLPVQFGGVTPQPGGVNPLGTQTAPLTPGIQQPLVQQPYAYGAGAAAYGQAGAYGQTTGAYVIDRNFFVSALNGVVVPL